MRRLDFLRAWLLAPFAFLRPAQATSVEWTSNVDLTGTLNTTTTNWYGIEAAQKARLLHMRSLPIPVLSDEDRARISAGEDVRVVWARRT